MSERHRPSSEALLRFSILSRVFVRLRAGEERSVAVRSVAACEHISFDGSVRCVSERTLYRWLAACVEAGLAGLDRQRRAASPSKALPESLLELIAKEKQRDPAASVPELIQRARALGLVPHGVRVHRSTVYRALKRSGLSLARRKGAKDRDSRRFAYPHRMDMVLCDGKPPTNNQTGAPARPASAASHSSSSTTRRATSSSPSSARPRPPRP